MPKFSATQILVLALSAIALAANVHAAPLEKRVGQNVTDVVEPWLQACAKAGGGDQCNSISQAASKTLLAAASPCDQQNAADAMIDLAKTLEASDADADGELIKFAQIFAQQPRNTPTSESVPYCQEAPKNAELDGLFQCQFQSTLQGTFVGGLAVGAPGTIPFGQDAPVSPPGSCPASTEGPVPDGKQLLDFIQELGGDAAASAPSVRR